MQKSNYKEEQIVLCWSKLNWVNRYQKSDLKTLSQSYSIAHTLPFRAIGSLVRVLSHPFVGAKPNPLNATKGEKKPTA
jgi:hypothetical protein